MRDSHTAFPTLGLFPSPLRGGVRGGGRPLVRWRLTKLRPPSPTLPRRGEGAYRRCGSPDGLDIHRFEYRSARARRAAARGRRHRQAFRDARRRAHRGRSHLARCRAGRVPRRDRPVRLRQVDPVQHHRRAARRLPGPRDRRGRDRDRPARLDRHGVPGGVDLPVAYRDRQRRLPARDRRHGQGAAHRARASTSSTWSASPASSGAIRPSFPAACASASRSRARSPPSRRSC